MLREYQKTGLDLIRDLYSRGQKKVLLHLATGGGKTVIFCEVLKGVHEKGKRAIVLVRGRKLVDQASQRLDREGVPHGVLMAGHKKFYPLLPIQVCSIDTVISRELRPEADIIVIDEADQATSEGYVNFLAQYPNAFFLPVTATPYTKKPMRHMANEVVTPVKVQELIDQGFLVNPIYYAPTIPNLKGIKMTNTADGRDFNQTQLSHVMSASSITGDIITHWKRIALGRPTIAFCVGVDHSKKMTEQMNASGIRAAHVDASFKDDERQKIIGQLERREIDVITNCGILCRGVDIPPVSAIIMARPTKSLNLFIQQAGRGTRPDINKNDFIILDHAKNVITHGFITDEHEVNLDGTENKDKQIKIRQCPSCYIIFQGAECPNGCVNEGGGPRELVYVDGELQRLEPKKEKDPIAEHLKQLKETCLERGYKKGWVYHRFLEKYGPEITDKYLPKRNVPWWIKQRA